MAEQWRLDQGRHRPGRWRWWILAWIATGVVAAEDWPRWRGAAFDGVSRETGWRTDWPSGGPAQLWQARVGVGYSSVAVSGGRLFTMGNLSDVDSVYCLDAQTGRGLWQHTYACPARDRNGYHGTRSTPTVDGDRVYTLSRHGHLFCLEAATGRVVWSKEFPRDYRSPVPQWGFAGSPLVEGDLLITEVGGPGTSVVAFDKRTGQERWRAGNDKVGYSSIVPFDQDGRRRLAVLSGEAVVGRAVENGAELWRFPWKTSYDVNAATPIVVGSRVFVSSGYGTGAALIDFSGGAPRAVWRSRQMSNHVGTCILRDGHLYGFDERELKCLDLETGRQLWAERKYGKGSLKRAGDHWILYGDRGYLAVADLTPAGCRELAGFQVLEGRDTWAVPVLANGLLYCRSMEDLVCLDLRP